jgi:hypothetical protein
MMQYMWMMIVLPIITEPGSMLDLMAEKEVNY